MKKYRVKVKEVRTVTTTMTIELLAKNKENAVKRAKKEYRPDTGSSKSKVARKLVGCKSLT